MDTLDQQGFQHALWPPPWRHIVHAAGHFIRVIIARCLRLQLPMAARETQWWILWTETLALNRQALPSLDRNVQGSQSVSTGQRIPRLRWLSAEGCEHAVWTQAFHSGRREDGIRQQVHGI